MGSTQDRWQAVRSSRSSSVPDLLRAFAVAVTLVTALTVTAQASGALPPTFHGVTIQEQPTAHDIKWMRRAGVGAVRVSFTWFNEEPTPGEHIWTEPDDAVRAITKAGARVLPIVFTSPAWLEQKPEQAPADSGRALRAWGSHLQALAERYGPGGDYPEHHPNFKPVRIWQLWNEPNLTSFWGSFPDPEAYARMLKKGRNALRSVDPQAKVMTAGLSTASQGMQPDFFLQRVIDASGPRVPFDILALHPYAKSIGEMKSRISKSVHVLRATGHGRMPVAVTEAGWGSAGPPGYPPSGTPRSQARKVTAFFSTLAHDRGLHVRQAYWYSWRDLRKDPEHCGFCTITGLLQADGTPKPALRAFQRSVGDLAKSRNRRGVPSRSPGVITRVSGAFSSDDRFGDLSQINVAGSASGSEMTIRQMTGSIWRIHDAAGVEGSGLCSRAPGPRTVVCELPEPPTLTVSLGDAEDSVRTIGGGFERFRIDLGDGDDRADLTGSGGIPHIDVEGAGGDDRIDGSTDTDSLSGGPGRDVIRGRQSGDRLIGARGLDRLFGSTGADELDSGNDFAPDEFKCGRGFDQVRRERNDRFLAHDCEAKNGNPGTLEPLRTDGSG